MPKPASLPEWASDGTLIVEPAAGLKATGWSNATRPPAKYMNWYMEKVYRWCEYLDSGALEGNHSVEGNFSTISGGTMTVAGLLTASAGISTTTLTASGLTTAAAITASGLITGTLGITISGAAADFAGASAIQLPERTLALDVSSGQQADGTVLYTGSAAQFSAASSYDCPILLHEQDRITGIEVGYSRDSGGTITFTLFERDLAGTNTALATKDVSAGAGAAITNFASPTTGSLPQLVDGSKTYFVRMAGGAADDLYGWLITYDRP